MHLDDYLLFGSIGFLGWECADKADSIARVMIEVWVYLGGV